jgi:UDP-N-acetyl-D-glucosamine dehydrogenase
MNYKIAMSLKETLENINLKKFSVEILGLGYVGFPLAVRLATNGINVIGIDINQERIERLQNNKLLDSELYLQKEFLQCRNKETLELSTIPKKSSKPKIGIICVPTPIPDKNTSSDIFVKAAVENFIESSKEGDVLILESSIEVGTTDKIMEIVKNKGFEVGKNYGISFCPERIDPSNKEWGIENIPRVIYCSDEITFEISKKIYDNVNGGNLIRVNSPKIAEVVKSFENAFRLVNISLVNELAILCDKLKINVKEVINAAATKPFGFMAHYPGAGAGGHCIPKDPRFLLESAKKLGSRFESIEHALKINQIMPKYIADTIENRLSELKLDKVALVCGLAYKANVEDMRDSPSFKIIEELSKRKFVLYGFDSFFNKDLMKKYLIENHMSNFNCQVLKNLENDSLKKINCLCIVQHHSDFNNKIKEIYENSLVPYIYDCQSKLQINKKSKTLLEYLGD